MGLFVVFRRKIIVIQPLSLLCSGPFGPVFVYRKPPARRVVPKSLRLYTPVESRNPLIKFAKRSDHLHNK